MSQTADPLAVGDAVLDVENDDDDDRGRMRVLEVTDESATDRTIDAQGTTVAAVNPDRYAEDDVVEVVFESDLDRRVSDWDEWDAATLPEQLATYCAEWGVTVRTYDFPRGRLEVDR